MQYIYANLLENILIIKCYIKNLEEIKLLDILLINKRKEQKSKINKNINYVKEISKKEEEKSKIY